MSSFDIGDITQSLLWKEKWSVLLLQRKWTGWLFCDDSLTLQHFLFNYFKMESHYIACSSLKFVIFLPQFPKQWYYKHVPPHAGCPVRFQNATTEVPCFRSYRVWCHCYVRLDRFLEGIFWCLAAFLASTHWVAVTAPHWDTRSSLLDIPLRHILWPLHTQLRGQIRWKLRRWHWFYN